jgi:putative flavoprotein involved in K+ transport
VTSQGEISTLDIETSIVSWLEKFEQAISSRDAVLFNSLFIERSYWRDLVAFTWNFRQVHGRDALSQLMWSVADEITPKNFRLSPNRPAPSLIPQSDDGMMEAFIEFETAAGTGDGYVQFVPDDASPAGVGAHILLTRLTSLDAVPSVWPPSGRFEVQHAGSRWSEFHEELHSYEDRDPEVLIVGGGQFGVQAAANLAHLGFDALVVDKKARVGDAWRTRYESLVLHAPVGMHHFSFMRFPESYPEYPPKDKFAEWFEAYVSSLDLAFWTSTEFLRGSYDEQAKLWTADLRLSDGSIRQLHPRHLIIATGSAEIPRVPALPGLDEFEGDVRHVAEFRSGTEYEGQNVLVVGVGTSAHDAALDIVTYGHGQATMLQRSPVIIVNLPTANLQYGDFNDRSVPTDLVDIRAMATLIYPLMLEKLREVTIHGNQLDSELHKGLKAAGLRLTDGEDGTGWHMRFFKTGGGYYINVGASEAIIAGQIKIRQFSDIERFVKNGVLLKSGEVLPFDAVILATGYEDPQVGIERYFGKDIADRVGKVVGFDPGGEFCVSSKPLPQEALWIMYGGIAHARWYAPLLAMQIGAELKGVVPQSFKEEGHPSRTPTESNL